MKSIKKYRLRKCTDINMDLPFYEVLDEEGLIMLDISKTDEDEYQILFHEGCSARNIAIDLLEEMIIETKGLIASEE